jgi:hypothetical protein
MIRRIRRLVDGMFIAFIAFAEARFAGGRPANPSLRLSVVRAR